MFVIALLVTRHNRDDIHGSVETLYYLKKGGTVEWSADLNDAEIYTSELAAAKSDALTFPVPKKAVVDFGLQRDEITADAETVELVIAQLGPLYKGIRLPASPLPKLADD